MANCSLATKSRGREPCAEVLKHKLYLQDRWQKVHLMSQVRLPCEAETQAVKATVFPCWYPLPANEEGPLCQRQWALRWSRASRLVGCLATLANSTLPLLESLPTFPLASLLCF